MNDHVDNVLSTWSVWKGDISLKFAGVWLDTALLLVEKLDLFIFFEKTFDVDDCV